MAESVKREFLFEVDERLFAADVRGVREVLEEADVTPVPGTDPGILGLSNLRGTLVVLADFGTLLGLSSDSGVDPVVVVLEHGGRRIGLRVDRVLGVAPTREDGLDVEGELLEALGARDILVGVGEYRSRPYYRVDLAAVFGRVLVEDSERVV